MTGDYPGEDREQGDASCPRVGLLEASAGF